MSNPVKTNLNLGNLKSDLLDLASKLNIDDEAKEVFVQAAILKVAGNLSATRERLAILYEYEKNYLELIQQYKEEIKFANNLQEELRKERTKFFAESLKEVSETLSSTQVDPNVASMWIKELVESYTKSIDMSTSLIEENVLSMLGEIKKEARSGIQSVANSSQEGDG